MDCNGTYPIQTVQPVYKLTESFKKCLRDFEEYGKNIVKATETTFNPILSRIEYDRNIEGVDKGDKPIQFI